MARMTNQQRIYIVKKLTTTIAHQLNDKLQNEIPDVFKGFNFSVVRSTPYPTSDLEKYTVHLNVPSTFQGDSCGNKANFIENHHRDITLPDSWYKDQYIKDNFEVYTELEPCMPRPRLFIEWNNEKKELIKYRRKINKTLEADYDTVTGVVSEIQYDIMEAKKFLAQFVEKLVFADAKEAEDLMNNMVEETKKLLA